MTTRSAASAAFDRFVFESIATQDGVTLERGVDVSRSGLIVSSATIDVDTASWLALQSRAGDDLLQLGDEGTDEQEDARGLADDLGDEFVGAFAIDTDDIESARSLLEPAARTRLMELERSSGPLVIIIDPGERLDDTTSLIVARPIHGRVAEVAASDIDVDAAVKLSARVAAALA